MGVLKSLPKEQVINKIKFENPWWETNKIDEYFSWMKKRLYFNLFSPLVYEKSVKRAVVLGQIVAGIPVWKLGEEAKFPNMTYTVFPGNVGHNETLKEIYEKLK